MITNNLTLYIDDLKALRKEIAESNSEDVVINKINLVDYNLVKYDQSRYSECLSLITGFHISITELRDSDSLDKNSFLPLFDGYIAKLHGLLPD